MTTSPKGARRTGTLRRLLGKAPKAVWLGLAALLTLFLLAMALVVGYYARIVSAKMDGRRYSLPARFYSAVWAVRPGDAYSPEDVERRLQRLRYAPVAEPPVGAGRYLVAKGRITVGLNDRETAYGRVPGETLWIEFRARRVTAVRRAENGTELPWAVFEPEVVGSVFDQKMEDRTLVQLERVPKVVKDAILATEDRDFYSHAGLSFRRLVGAVVQSVTRGRSVRGTSTLTQQLVKNLFLTQERTLRRKMIEALLALIVESKYGKDEIFESYLNEIYLGQRGSVSVTGVEEAARLYFGKPVHQLDLPEAALLAGLISSPGRFSPFRSPDRARERRAVVLKGMLDEEKIDRTAYEAALAAPLTHVGAPVTGIQASHFVDVVLGELKESRQTLQQQGLSVYTTLDPEMQAAAQAAVEKGLVDLEGRYRRLRASAAAQAPLEAALIALDPETGAIRALVGGRDYQTSQFNRVTQARRQPGSLFKPFVYLAALSRRDLVPPITPATVLQDSPIALLFGAGEDDTWSPRNYDGEFRGPVTVRQALEQSLNIPTVRLAVTEVAAGQTLLPDVIETARKAGITSTLKPYPAMALGAFEITPLEIAAAYSAFANGGVKVEPTALIGVVGPGGRRIESRDRPLTRALDLDAVCVLDSLLRGVVDRGTGGSARRLGAHGVFAGKTGTTNDGRDAWFVAFSPRLLVAVWVGFDDNRGLNLSGTMAALPIYATFAKAVPAHLFEEPFPVTPGVVTVSIDPATGMRVTEDCPSSFDELFLAGTEPTLPCTVHGTGAAAAAARDGGATAP